MMRLYRDLTGTCLVPGGSVVAMGAFDGLHRGHQALLKQACERARALELAAVVVSFEPLPRAVLSSHALPRISSVRDKLLGFSGSGMTHALILRFNAMLATMDASDFVRRVLVQHLNVKEVWLGVDFRFGHQREGTLALLQRIGDELGFIVRTLSPVLQDGKRISASFIRRCLDAGQLDTAARLLGRPFVMEGRVHRGNQLGRTLGFPTANIPLYRRVTPVHGIFAVRVGLDGAACSWPGVASLGVRPTVNSVVEPLLEAHLFDFEGDLYGRRLAVEFVARLRDEKKFDSLETLKQQMHQDARLARDILGMNFVHTPE